MNEGMGIYLHLENVKEEELDELLQRMDDLLLNFGIRYGGIANWYVPIDMKNRDHVMYVGEQVLKEVTWLKGIFSHAAIMNHANVCELEQVEVQKRECSEHLKDKLQCYEDYYKRTGKLAHDIIVNEENKLVDGYTSWYLAKKYDLRPDIFQCLNDAPVRKVVRGRHVYAKNEKWKIRNDKFYSWVYTLRKPVVPGDVLQVWTAKGLAYMQVEAICYVTGKEFCSQYRRVRIHTGSSMDAPDCAEVRMKE